MAACEYAARLGPITIGLRRDLVFSRQELGSRIKYVAHDPVTFQNHSFSPIEYRIMCAIVPGRTLSNAFERLIADRALSQTDEETFYRFVLSLHGKQLIQLPITQPDILYERYSMRRAARWSAMHRSLFFLKVPLVAPDRFLSSTVRYVGWLFSRSGLALWIGLMLFALWNCWGRFGEIFEESGRLFQLGNLPVMWISLVVLKAVHECGHAYSCKRLGGEVPEMGVVFILMTPVAYVDAGASWKFTSKWHRIAVGMAGMYVEAIIAALAALVWVSTPPGFLHMAALNVIVLASAVTVLFNINPLMRFDGYYVLSDLCGVVNLRERSDRWLKGWFQRRVLRLPVADEELDRREHWLYGTYGPASAVYKLMLAFSITAMVAMQWPLIGAGLALLCAWQMLLTPLRRALGYLWRAEETASVRVRARVLAVATILAAALITTGFPVPSGVSGSGLLDSSSRQTVRAPETGFVREIVVAQGDLVHSSQPLCAIENPALEIDALRADGELKAELARRAALELIDPGQAAALREKIDYLSERAAAIAVRREAMRVRAGLAGRVAAAENLPPIGTFVVRGDELFQIHAGRPMLRVVFLAADAARAQLRPGGRAQVRWTVEPGRLVLGRVRAVLPSASRTDVPEALTMHGGGDVFASPGESGVIVADQAYVHVFIEPESVPANVKGGLTARVRIAGPYRSLAGWLRRQVLDFYHAWKMS